MVSKQTGIKKCTASILIFVSLSNLAIVPINAESWKQRRNFPNPVQPTIASKRSPPRSQNQRLTQRVPPPLKGGGGGPRTGTEGAGANFHHSLTEYIHHLKQLKSTSPDIALQNQISQVIAILRNRLFFSGPFKKAVTSKGGNQTDFIYVIGSYKGDHGREDFVMEYQEAVASVKWQVISKGVINKAVIGDRLPVISKDVKSKIRNPQSEIESERGTLREMSQFQQRSGIVPPLDCVLQVPLCGKAGGGIASIGMKLIVQAMVGSGWQLTNVQSSRGSPLPRGERVQPANTSWRARVRVAELIRKLKQGKVQLVQKYSADNGKILLVQEGLKKIGNNMEKFVDELVNQGYEFMEESGIVSIVRGLSAGMTKPSEDKKDLIRMEFEDLVEDMKKKSTVLKQYPKSGKERPDCFVSYAWEKDTQEFVKDHLVPDLQRAGIEVVIDYLNLTIGKNVIDHEIRIGETDYVCVVGTPLLRQKYDDYKNAIKASGIGIEMIVLHHKRFQKWKDGIHPSKTVFPLLFKGRGDTALTPVLEPIVYGNDGTGGGVKLTEEYPYSEPSGYYYEVLRILSGMLGFRHDEVLKQFKIYEKEINENKITEDNMKRLKSWREKKKLEQDQLGQISETMDKQTNLKKLQEWKLGSEEQTRLEEITNQCGSVLKKEVEDYLVKKHTVRFENLPPENQLRIERKKYLDKLEQYFEPREDKKVVVKTSGLGGVGKTQLALMYAHKSMKAGLYPLLIWWINAETTSSLVDSFSKLGERIWIKRWQEESLENFIGRIKDYLREHASWLLIFDNAEDAETIRDYIPNGLGHVLITSRNPNFDTIAGKNVIEVKTYSRPQSMEYIHKVTGSKEEDKILGELAEELGDLALALAQACAYISKTKISVEKYMKQYGEARQFLQKKEKAPTGYPHTVQTTWLLSMQKVREDKESGKIAEELTNLCAFLTPSDIPKHLLKSYVMKQYHLNSTEAGIEVDNALGLLASFSLITLKQDSIDIHRLVQQVIRDKIEDKFMGKILTIGVQELKDYKEQGMHSSLLQELFKDFGLVQDKEKYMNFFWDQLKQNEDILKVIENPKELKSYLLKRVPIDPIALNSSKDPWIVLWLAGYAEHFRKAHKFEEAKIVEELLEKVLKRFSRSYFTEVPVEGDGSCGFHAFAIGLMECIHNGSLRLDEKKHESFLKLFGHNVLGQATPAAIKQVQEWVKKNYEYRDQKKIYDQMTTVLRLLNGTILHRDEVWYRIADQINKDLKNMADQAKDDQGHINLQNFNEILAVSYLNIGGFAKQLQEFLKQEQSQAGSDEWTEAVKAWLLSVRDLYINEVVNQLWASQNIELPLLGEYFDLSVFVHEGSQEQKIFNAQQDSDNNNNPEIHLSYNGTHYNYLRSKRLRQSTVTDGNDPENNNNNNNDNNNSKKDSKEDNKGPDGKEEKKEKKEDKDQNREGRKDRDKDDKQEDKKETESAKESKDPIKTEFLRMRFQKFLSELQIQSVVNCFITYAWEDEKDEKDDAKRVNPWIQKRLVPDLEQVINLRLVVDYKNLRPGDNVLGHEGLVCQTDYVLVIGTSKLRKRWDDYWKVMPDKGQEIGERPGIVEELMYLRWRLFIGKYGRETTIPLMFKGDKQVSLPDFLGKESHVYPNCREEQNYYGEVIRIVSRFLGKTREEKDQWQEKLGQGWKQIEKEIVSHNFTEIEIKELEGWKQEKLEADHKVMEQLEKASKEGNNLLKKPSDFISVPAKPLRMQDGPMVTELLRQRLMRSLNQAKIEDFGWYVPLKAGTQIRSENLVDMEQAVMDFLDRATPDENLLILGDSGAGKTLFCRSIEKKLLEADKSKYVPIYIRLQQAQNNKRCIEETLENLGYSTSEINELKEKREFLFLLDGYDELGEMVNLYQSSQIQQWKGKVIFTCRTQYAGHIEDLKGQFLRRDQSDLPVGEVTTLYVQPFSKGQMEEYLRKHAQAKGEAEETYLKLFKEQYSQLKELGENPLILRLLVLTLPESLQILNPTRAKIYELFFKKWFEREFGRSEKKRRKDLISQQLKLSGYVKSAVGFTQWLGWETFMSSGKLSQFVTRKVVQERPWMRTKSKQTDPLAETFFDPRALLEREGSPIRRIAEDTYEFMHKSFQEYFVAREPFDEIKKERKTEGFINGESSLNKKLLTREHGVIRFLVDMVSEELEKNRDILLKVVKRTREEIGASIAVAAANVMTVLNAAGVSFSREDLSHVKIHGADLSYGVFDSTDFKAAVLKGVKFQRAWLRNARFEGAEMSGVEFGEKPYINHIDYIGTIAYSSDGKFLATVGEDNIVIVWEAETGKGVKHLRAHTGEVRSVNFSPDGRLLATGDQKNMVIVWELGTGKKLIMLRGPMGHVARMNFSFDGKLLAVGYWDNTMVVVWEVETGKKLKMLEGYKYYMASANFSPNGKLLVTGSMDYAVRVWDVATWKEVTTLSGHRAPLSSMTFSWDGKLLATGSRDYTVRVWEVATWKEVIVLSGHMDGVSSVNFSPNGKLLATGSWDYTMRVWEVETGKELTVLKGARGAMYHGLFLPEGKLLAIATWDYKVRVWEVGIRKEVIAFKGLGDSASTVNFSPDGRLLATGDQKNMVIVWELGTGKKLTMLKRPGGRMYSVNFSPDGRLLATGDQKNMVIVWDLRTGKKLTKIKRLMGSVYSVNFSPDGKLLATGGWIGEVRVWEVETGKEVKHLRAHTGDVRSLNFSPDGRLLATGDEKNMVIVWELGTGKKLIMLEGPRGGVASVNFSPNGKLLYTERMDKTVSVYEVETWLPNYHRIIHTPGKLIGVFREHTDLVTSVNFSPNGKLLATGSRDYTVRVWEVETGKELIVLKGYMGTVTGVTFSLDGKFLATGSDDGSIKVWDISRIQDILFPFRLSAKQVGERVLVLWSINHPLFFADASIQDVRGLSESNRYLMLQRGAVDKTSEYRWTDENGIIYRFYRDINKNNNSPGIRVDVEDNKTGMTEQGLLLMNEYKGDHGIKYKVTKESQHLTLGQFLKKLINRGYYFVVHELKVYIVRSRLRGGNTEDIL